MGLGLEEVRALEPGAWVPSVPVLVLATAVLVGGYFLSAWLWGRVVFDLGGPRLPPWVSVRVFMVANLGRYVPGKIWQIAGLAALARRRGVPAPTAAAAAVVGQAVSIAAATLVGMVGFVSSPAEMRAWSLAIAAAAAALVVAIVAPPCFRGAVRLWLRVTSTPLPEHVSGLHGARWLALYVLNWMVYAFSFWLLVLSFGLEAPLVPVASAFAAAYVLGYVMIFAPAGIGVREGFLVALLSPELGVAAAGAIAIIARLWTTVVELVPAAALWLGGSGEGRRDVAESVDG